MKKFNFLVIASVMAISGLLIVGSVQARPVNDNALVSTTVKVESYRLARNGDVFQAGQASATIISADGLMLTNSHVVLDSQNDPYDVFGICLSYSNNEEPICEYSAYLVAYDQDLDLALLKINPLNNRGGLVGSLPSLTYDHEVSIEQGEAVDIYGYPDVGGKTLTRTTGQLSGFEDKNGLTYYKTDTDISAGNSGGTALDENGSFIGVPTYLLSSYDNLGYIISLNDAREFINSSYYFELTENQQALEVLKAKQNLLNDANDFGYYEHPYYPRFSLSAGTDWEWKNLSRTSLSLFNESNKNSKLIEIETLNFPFEVSQEFTDEIDRVINLFSEDLTDYQEEEITLGDYPAKLITFNLFGEKYFSYAVVYGSSLLSLSYSVSLEDLETDLPVFEEVVQSFNFLEEPNLKTSAIKTFIQADPAFAISTAGNWQIMRNQDASAEDLMAVFYHPSAIHGQINLSYSEIEDDEKVLNNEQLLDSAIKGMEYFGDLKLISKDSDVMLDNLSGFSITYLNEDYDQEKVKGSTISLRHGDYLYQITYEDRASSYDNHLPDFMNILKSFKNYDQSEEIIGKGQYQLGSLDYDFMDIANHRFEKAITNLADKNVISAYSGSSFRPEKLITASEAKKYILNSFNISKRSQQLASEVNFLSGDSVTLADGLKAMLKAYDLPIWQDINGDAPDWKPYLDKGYELGIVPDGFFSHDQQLTRAEFVYLLDSLLSSFESF